MKRLDSTTVYTDAWLSVRRDTVRRPDGARGTYSVVDTADCSLVIPVDGERLALVEQYRYPVSGRRWEFPSGSIDDRVDADAAAAAARELREETGLTAATLVAVGAVDTMPSTLNQTCSVFLATDLTHGRPQRETDEEDMQSAWFTRSEVEVLMADGVITDAKSLAAYALLRLREDRAGVERTTPG